MPVFVEDPSQLSKARLKSDLIAHNVALPPATSRKGIYVELHTRHVDQKKCADFSSDEDAETDEETNYAEILDPSSLTDDGLKAALLQHGVKAGPIVASTRALYERKLRNLLFSNGHDKVNDKVDEADEAVLYSDSEEEENSEEEEEKPATEEIQTQTEPADQCQEDDTQELSSQGEDYVYPQCFLVSSRQRVCAAKNSKPCPKRNPRNVLKSSHSAQIPSGISRASSIDQPSGLATGLSEQQSILSNGSLISSQNFSITQMVEEMEGRTSCSSLADASDINQSVVQSHWSRSNRPVVKVPFEDKYNSPDLQFYTPMAGFNEWTRKDPALDPVQERFKDLLADTPTGIYASRRRPIKGAAGRPVQYAYPEIPLSPTTLERQEVEKRLVSLKIQILVFFFVAIILYVIYVCVEDYSFNPLLALIDILNQGLDTDESGIQEVEEFLEVE